MKIIQDKAIGLERVEGGISLIIDSSTDVKKKVF
jgi:hypothetical protein